MSDTVECQCGSRIRQAENGRWYHVKTREWRCAPYPHWDMATPRTEQLQITEDGA